MRYVVEEETCPRCAKCERWRNMPEVIRDPWLLWDRFPCPPPGNNKARLLLQLDWTGQMGSKDGCRALRRVATRCKVDLSGVEFFPSSLNDCDELFTALGVCGAQCVIAIILACICLIFVFILVIVCYRYVHRGDKPSSPTITKVLATDQTALNTQVNRYYLQSQYYYRAGNIPERRGLPFEARTTENGVEARLIKAIQQTPVHAAYPVDEVCSQCMHPSRHSTFSRGRHRYEPIYWKDNLDKRVPSNDSLHRKQLDRHRSATASSSDMSHYYDYISDNGYDSCSGRRSNHSTVYFPHTGSYRESPYNYGDSRYSDDDRGIPYPKFPIKEHDVRDNAHKDVNHYNLSNRDSSSERCDKTSTNGYLTGPRRDASKDSIEVHNRIPTPNRLNDLYYVKEDPPFISSEPNILNDLDRNKSIKGYKYTYNPSFDEDTTTASKPDITDSTSPETPSECFEFDESVGKLDTLSIVAVKSPNNRKKQNSLNFRPHRNSETTSLSDISPKSNSLKDYRVNDRYIKQK